jgi:ribosomal protein S18 acetylase RimI-like enzyme
MEIKLLKNTKIEIIYEAFISAFSDYEVKIHLTLTDFQNMFKTRSLRLEYSFGCFIDDKLIGFILCGFRDINGCKFLYDGGTGVNREYRRKSISDLLLTHLLDYCKQNNIMAFYLEVLENNSPAIELYKKHGFINTRKFNCFTANKEEIIRIPNRDYELNTDIEKFNQILLTPYSLYSPCWQNNIISIRNNFANYNYLSICYNNEIIAYGFIEKYRGDIPQIGLLDKWKDRGIEMILINYLSEKTYSGTIRFINVEENNYICNKLLEIGFNCFINQYEMKLEF